jgi:hypothetical protein
MERVQSLIHKLTEQQKKGALPEQLLITVQLLQQELSSPRNTSSLLGTSKVAVIVPAGPLKNIVKPEENQKEVYQLNITEEDFLDEEAGADETQEFTIATENNKPSEIEEKYAPKPVVGGSHNEFEHPAFNSMEETLTLTQQSKKELHEVIANPQESLNDRLKQEKTELGHVLKETPIKDLRKAIGVNDKFLFLNELFRGDEAMYERSLKTINNFHILPEAEYWINRELKVKLGWNDTNETVQHFYQLVRRRFS